MEQLTAVSGTQLEPLHTNVDVPHFLVAPDEHRRRSAGTGPVGIPTRVHDASLNADTPHAGLDQAWSAGCRAGRCRADGTATEEAPHKILAKYAKIH